MPKRVLQGVVVSNKGDKTVVVQVERRLMHPVYKNLLQHQKYAAHDEENRLQEGEPGKNPRMSACVEESSLK
ncbi:MAG: 30S ribosomal protein S17 [Alphaproteobacteria bacterium]|nr:MAG: 30S ribosomal protein S17 [Alphaproteobacteria bacterium]